jgi:CDGSH-type Zn-finger protein/truncated hemoglobin YjbI
MSNRDDAAGGTSQPAARGRLAQVIATRGGLAAPEAPFVIEHREHLIYMLCQAAELEHGIMCQYLFVGADGNPVQRAAGASAEHYAICRCGHSQNKPFCSGMHWYVDFRDPEPDPGAEPTLFEHAGGLPALTRMTRLLYEKHVPADPLLAPLFATMAPEHPGREAMWLAEVFGGPASYSRERGGSRQPASSHLWSREDVAAHAADIMQRLRDGSMPCDGAWPGERIDVFQRWAESGAEP